jgi:transcription-repair coupling factor (superfamily II helicase)
MPSTNPILDALSSCTAVRELAARLPSAGSRRTLGGIAGSADVGVVAALHRLNPERVFVVLTPGPGEAAAAEADLEALLGESGGSHLYPQKEALPYEESEANLEIGGLRVEAVESVFSGRTKILVTTHRALQERVPIPTHLTQLRMTVRVGETLDLTEMAHVLEDRGFERVPLVEEVGQFAVRGGILDVFSVGAGDPVSTQRAIG